MSDLVRMVESLPWACGVRLIGTTPAGLVAVFKPGGVLSHPNPGKGGRDRALLPWPYRTESECFTSPEADIPDLHLLHRLDGPTSGIVLLATNQGEADRVRELFARKQVEKVYYAMVKGGLRSPRELWRDRLGTVRERGVARTRTGGGAESVTEARSPCRPPRHAPFTLLELRPQTGRTHQLRVQCAQRKMPILGDQTYGDFSWNREWQKASGEKGLYLHAARITLPGSGSGGELLTLSAAWPDYFSEALRHVGYPPNGLPAPVDRIATRQTSRKRD